MDFHRILDPSTPASAPVPNTAVGSHLIPASSTPQDDSFSFYNPEPWLYSVSQLPQSTTPSSSTRTSPSSLGSVHISLPNDLTNNNQAVTHSLVECFTLDLQNAGLCATGVEVRYHRSIAQLIIDRLGALEGVGSVTLRIPDYAINDPGQHPQAYNGSPKSQKTT